MKDLFQKQKYVIVKKFLDPQFSQTLYEYLKFSTQVSILQKQNI